MTVERKGCPNCDVPTCGCPGDAYCGCERLISLGTCQQCGRYSSDRYCYATDACKELGGADVL